MTTETMTTEKYAALRRSGQLPAAELPTEERCEAFGHRVSLDWMAAYADRAHAERVKARLLALVGTVCLECIRWRARATESAAWIEAGSVRTEILHWQERQQVAARGVDERAREQARVAPPCRRWPSVVEKPFGGM